LLSSVLAVGCAKATDPLPNKNTNWLRDCISDASCTDGLSCVCGVCTLRCAAASECGAAGTNVACAGLASAPQCAGLNAHESGSICVATCKRTSDCASYGEGLECGDGTCAKTSGATGVAGTTTDAGGDSGQQPDAGKTGVVSVSGPSGPCGNGVIDSGEECDGTAAIAGGRCVDCKLVCAADRANCNADVSDGCERDISQTKDLPAGSAMLPAGCAQVLAENQADPSSVAVDGARVYWTNQGTFDGVGNYQHDGSVVAMPLEGGELVVLAAGQTFPQSLTLAGGYAYWIDNDT
jgi:hypothetical protein